jgi:RNA polymerase sigma factor (sigma-70 family)
MPSLPELIQGCLNRDPHLMEQFYLRFAPEMWVVCLRYTRNAMMAEDVMQEGFIRTFDLIGQYEGKGVFEGWLRRVFVSTAINHYKKFYRFDKLSLELNHIDTFQIPDSGDAISKMNTDQLLELLDELPTGFKVVFNLYAIEGYNHREIATMLGCSEGTSKSQLARARAYLQKLILNQGRIAIPVTTKSCQK